MRRSRAKEITKPPTLLEDKHKPGPADVDHSHGVIYSCLEQRTNISRQKTKLVYPGTLSTGAAKWWLFACFLHLDCKITRWLLVCVPLVSDPACLRNMKHWCVQRDAECSKQTSLPWIYFSFLPFYSTVLVRNFTCISLTRSGDIRFGGRESRPRVASRDPLPARVPSQREVQLAAQTDASFRWKSRKRLK